MNFVRRGFIGMMRRKGKSLILLAVLFILGNLIAGAISIQQATNMLNITLERDWGLLSSLRLTISRLTH